MSVRKIAQNLVVIAAIILALSLVSGSVLGQPILLSYVETGSMSPTLEPGEGFVAIPTQFDNSIREGDVIIFKAEEIQGGGLTTHRVVERTENSYITKGDANPFTDQDSSEPPVRRAQIVAQALQMNGEVVAIPHLGKVVEGTQMVLTTTQRHLAGLLGTRSLLGAQGFAYVFFFVTLIWYILGEWRSSNTQRADREGSRMTGANVRLVVGALALLLLLGATAAMVGPSETQKHEIVSSEFESNRPTVIPAGESNDVIYPVSNGGLVPVTVYLVSASNGVKIQPHQTYVRGRTVVNATVTLHAPDETGYYRRFVTEHRYLAILPTSVIDSLYRIHPWAPIVAIDALIGIPFYIFGITLLGTGRIRNRSRSRDLSTLTRIRRAIRNLY
ncbi:signal peptidase I [Halobellus sp. Atlit-38R]|uniref:signal peptidase I n=1 Tax=Halobellus sp. Atlit-38R TaxID=2282131 RepID=UPI000EF22025|nr:signal peptidase I [Halobellus sp. Atlit-38R]RLM89215.1 signal peptidase I [Halobellus sp. Atlit-38R]